jgi:anti-sigma B factor antagonist
MARWHNGGPESSLSIEIGRSDGTYNVTLQGVLDLSSSNRLDAAIDAALVSDAHQVLVDLDGLDFVDSTGLATILRASRRADGNGRLRMTHGTGEVAQLFRLTALDLVLPFD